MHYTVASDRLQVQVLVGAVLSSEVTQDSLTVLNRSHME